MDVYLFLETALSVAVPIKSQAIYSLSLLLGFSSCLFQVSVAEMSVLRVRTPYKVLNLLCGRKDIVKRSK